jgi:catechol-2,3-dioxygenase
MKRMHIHLAVKEIPESIKFYSTMFGVDPSSACRAKVEG